MILLDTNVLSELMRPDPAPAVATWIARHPLAALCTAAPCQAEILAGIALLPDGRRRTDLAAAAQAMFADDFENRILPFDSAAADAYAALFAARRQAGRPAAAVDLMIAAIARVAGATVATRNVTDFAGCDLAVANPWDDA